MVSTRPIDVVKALYTCFEQRDLEGALALVSEDCVLRQDPALPWGGTYRGPDGAAEFYMALVGSIDSTVTRLALFEAGEHVIQYGKTSGIAHETGTTFTSPECHVWHVVDGKIAGGEMYIDSTAMLQTLATTQ